MNATLPCPWAPYQGQRYLAATFSRIPVPPHGDPQYRGIMTGVTYLDHPLLIALGRMRLETLITFFAVAKNLQIGRAHV